LALWIKYFGKPTKRAVIGLFYLFGEDTPGEFLKLEVIGNAFAALALS